MAVNTSSPLTMKSAPPISPTIANNAPTQSTIRIAPNMRGTKKTWQVPAINLPATPQTAIPNLILLQQQQMIKRNKAASPNDT